MASLANKVLVVIGRGASVVNPDPSGSSTATLLESSPPFPALQSLAERGTLGTLTKVAGSPSPPSLLLQLLGAKSIHELSSPAWLEQFTTVPRIGIFTDDSHEAQPYRLVSPVSFVVDDEELSWNDADLARATKQRIAEVDILYVSLKRGGDAARTLAAMNAVVDAHKGEPLLIRCALFSWRDERDEEVDAEKVYAISKSNIAAMGQIPRPMQSHQERNGRHVAIRKCVSIPV